MAIRGIIFDLDGTLVDSQLDFDAMRREMAIPHDHPLLETIAALPTEDAERCRRILAEHEQTGAQRATLFPGVREFLQTLDARGMKKAIVTRNSRATTLATLARLELELHPIVSREDGPAKPHPAALWSICQAWGLEPRECVMVGDYRFDIEAGRNAGTHTVLFTGAGGPSHLAEHEGADFTFHAFDQADALWDWIAQIDLGG